MARFVAVAMMGATVTACGSSATSAAPPSKTGTPYVVNALLPLTGPDAFLGKRERAALNFLSAQVTRSGGIDGHPLEFKVIDNTSVPSVAVSLASGLINSHVPVFLDGTSVTTDAPVDALTSGHGPVIYELTPAITPKPGSYIFSADTSLPSESLASVRFVASHHWTKAAAITSTDASGVVAWQDVTTALPQAGAGNTIDVVNHQVFAPNAVSVTTQLSAIKASNPQVIFAYGTGASIGVVFNGMQQLGMENIPVMVVASDQSYALMQHFGSTVPAQLFVPGMTLQASNVPAADRASLSSFESVISAANLRPDIAEALAWDPGQILVAALRHLGVGASATRIKSYIEGLKSFHGALGTYNFTKTNHRGLSLADVRIEQYNAAQQGAWTTVSGPGGIGAP